MKERITYANVMSTVAAFLALAGGSTAIALKGKNSVKKGDIAKASVRAREIAKGAVRSWEVKNETLKIGDIGPNAVGASEIVDGSVGGPEIGAGAVGTPEIGAGAVGTSELAVTPTVKVSRSGVSVPIPDSDFTELSFQSETGENFDPFDMWDPATPEVVTVPEAGTYLGVLEVNWSADDTAAPGGLADQGSRLAQLSTGATGNSRSLIPVVRLPNGGSTFQTATGIFNLDAGATVRAHLYQTNEDASDVNAFGTLQLIWLGPGLAGFN